MRPSQIVAANADQIREIIARYPVRNPRLFGSVARGEDTGTSDVDILVERLDGLTYFALAKLQRELEECLGFRVDIATDGEISPRIAPRVLRDLRPLKQ